VLNRKAARRYARALFQWAADNQQVETIQRELDEVRLQIETVPDLEEVLTHPLIPDADKGRLIRTAFEGRVSAPLLAFLMLLEQHRRMDLLPAVYEEFALQALDYHGVVQAEVVTSVPLPAEDRQRLESLLARRLGKTVHLYPRVDPETIGGMLVRVGDTVVDGSIKTSLESLRERLKRASLQAV
jgi:F-type H+-transporting ATPase subunit delta